MHDFELYGFSVFETIAARRGRFWHLQQHWERLASSGESFGLEAPSWSGFVQLLERCHNQDQDEILRCALVKRGGRWSDLPSSTEVQFLKKVLLPDARPLHLTLSEDRLPPDDPMRCYKTGSRLLYHARFLQAAEQGFQDVVFCDTRDRILETSTANLLFLLDGQWVTPPLLDGLLPGLYRDWLLDRQLIAERPVQLEDLAGCQAMALSNAVRGLVPVMGLDHHSWPIEPVLALKDQIGPRTWQDLEYWSQREP